MRATAEIAPGITVEYVERNNHHIIHQDGARRLYVVCRGMRREGEMWAILDGGYAQLMELPGTTKDAAIARAVAMLRDGEIDQMIKHHSARAPAAALAVVALEEANDPRNWTAAKIRRALAEKRAEHERSMRRFLEEIAQLEAALAKK
jgi:hypothetical protein